MASIYDIKPHFQNCLRPLSDFLAKQDITPNQVTLIALALSFLMGACLFFMPNDPHVLLLIPVFLFIRMVLNAIDGMLAREHQMKSALGTFLNELGDVLSDTFLYLPFGMLPFASMPLVIAIVLLAMLSEMTGVIGIQAGATRRYDGPMGKSDRALAFGLMALVLSFYPQFFPWINIALSIIALLLMLTIVNRIKNALREMT